MEYDTDTPALTPLNDLILRIAQYQDQSAFSALFEQHATKLKAFAMKCGANDADADEILQECLLTVWRKAHTFNPQVASGSTWLYTIIRNKRIDFLRKEKPDQVVSDDLWPEPSGEELHTEVESDLNAKVVRTLIEGLPLEQRQIVYQVYFEGKSHSEIAAELDVPLGTVKSRLRLAMKKLDTLAQDHMSWLIIILLMKF